MSHSLLSEVLVAEMSSIEDNGTREDSLVDIGTLEDTLVVPSTLVAPSTLEDTLVVSSLSPTVISSHF